MDHTLTLKNPKVLDLPVRSGLLMSLGVSGGELFAVCANEIHWGSYGDVSAEKGTTSAGNVPKGWKKLKIDRLPVPHRNTLLRCGDELHILSKDGRHIINMSSLDSEFKEAKLAEQVFAFGEWTGVEEEKSRLTIRLRQLEKKLEVTSKIPSMALGWSNGVALAVKDELVILAEDGEVTDISASHPIDRLLRLDDDDHLLVGGVTKSTLMLTIVDCRTSAVLRECKVDLKFGTSVSPARLVGLASVEGLVFALISEGARNHWITVSLDEEMPFDTSSQLPPTSYVQSFAILPRENGTYSMVFSSQNQDVSNIGFYRLNDEKGWDPISTAFKSPRGHPVTAAYADGRVFVGCNIGGPDKPPGVVYVYEVEV